MPILDSNGLNYPPYDGAKLLKKADERDRTSPKLKEEKKQLKNAKNALLSSTSVENEYVDLTSSIPMTAENAKVVVYCVYEKPRVIFPRTNLTTTNVCCWLRASQVLSIHAKHFYFHLIQSLKQQVLFCIPPHSRVQCNVNWSPLLWIGCWQRWSMQPL